MAEFQAKKLNANEINNGQKWEYGQSPSTETFNAPIEGCLYLQERSIKTEKELQNIKSVLLGNNKFVEITTEQAYVRRQTADGANIFDDQYARVTKIQGDTVKSTNLFYETSHMTAFSGLTISYNEATQEFTINGTTSTHGNIVLSSTLKIPNASAGKYYTVARIKTGGSVTFADGGQNFLYSLFKKGNYTEFMPSRLYESSGNHSYTTISLSTKGLDATEYTVYLQIVNNNFTELVFDNFKFKLQIVEGSYSTSKLPAYMPYFAGLKHTYFDSIKSTNADGTQEDIYQLPVPVELPKYDSILPQELKIEKANDKVIINGTTIKVSKSVDLGDWQLYTYTPNSNLACVYGSQIVPMGWGSDTPANSVGFSKGVYLTNTNYVTIGVWFHKVDFLAETGVDTSNETAINKYLSNNPLIIERQLQNPNTLPLECPQYYTAWNNGSETVIQGETDNSEFGAMPTITQFYLGKVGE